MGRDTIHADPASAVGAAILGAGWGLLITIALSVRSRPPAIKCETLMQGPPDGLPNYRLLTGVDDAEFCHRVSAALDLGYELYGSPAATFDGRSVIVAQALIWPRNAGVHRPGERRDD